MTSQLRPYRLDRPTPDSVATSDLGALPTSSDGSQKPDGGAIRVIHIDDDRLDHLLIRKCLRDLDPQSYDVTHVESVDDARRLLAAEHFDVGLVDHQLGAETGIGLIAELGGRLCDTPMILLTGQGGHAVEIEATNAGAFDYLDKSELTPLLLERTIRGTRAQFETVKQLRESQSKLEEAKLEAEAANLAKSQFLANMSHDLRTPLNAILGFSEIIRDGSTGAINQDRLTEYANDIHVSGRLLLSMVNNLLDLSKIETGKLEVKDGSIDIREALASAMKIAKPDIDAAGLSIRLDVRSGLPQLRADRQLVDRLLINLLSNATKYNQRGGNIRLCADLSAGGLFLRVEDSGTGIAQAEIDRAMGRTERNGPALTDSHGSGLGLALVSAIMRCHGGSVHIANVHPNGTQITATFPLERLLGAIGSS